MDDRCETLQGWINGVVGELNHVHCHTGSLGNEEPKYSFAV
ncbi:hypothetical protein [Flocculibacter collagenilyticus]|nr:hypothetical protein [Flocculibacter collagenilyticus]